MQHILKLAFRLSAIAIALFVIVPAGAQSGGNGPALTRVTIVAESAEQSVFQLDFAPIAPPFSTAMEDVTRPRLQLNNTRRAPSAATSRYNGLVSAMEFDAAADGLRISFLARAPSKILTASNNSTQLLVTVKRLSVAEMASLPARKRVEEEQGKEEGALPQAYDPPPGEDGFEMVMLKYADVSEIVGLLTDGITVKSNNVFIRREPGFGSPGTNGVNYGLNQNQQDENDRPLGESVDSSLAIDRRLNAIWIKGSLQRIARIKEQIALIDIPVDSVILETQFVELTETGSRNIGIDFANANGQSGVGTLQIGQYIPFGFSTDKPLGSLSLQAALYAQIQKGEGRILSKPRIAAQSGSTAKIITGDALPILTSITLSGVNGVSQQVQYVNVGVTLQIAPRVSPDGYVTSHIYGVVSSVTGFAQGYPTISQREAETSASVRDGETFVIGGLTQENVLTSKTKVPLLGDLPLVGEAFKVEKTTKSKTELYIVITPYIVKHRRFEDVAAQSQSEQATSPTP